MTNGFLAYYEIKDFIAGGATVKFDSTARSYYAYKFATFIISDLFSLSIRGNQWVGYDNPQSIASKIGYVNSKNLGGGLSSFFSRCSILLA